LDATSEETLSFEYVVFRKAIGLGLLISFRDRNEHRIFKQLLQLVPGLQERLFAGNEEELVHIADLVINHLLHLHYSTQVTFWVA
jgi:hypothetical protein